MEIKSFNSGDDLLTFMEERAKAQQESFAKQSKQFRLAKGEISFLCVSFHPRTLLLPAFVAKLVAWGSGEVRGYINSYGVLCLNLPCRLTRSGNNVKGENIFDILNKETNQPYADMESANWDCFTYPMQWFGVRSDGLRVPVRPEVDLRSITPEIAQQHNLHQVKDIADLCNFWNALWEER